MLMMAGRGGATKLASSMMLVARCFSTATARGMLVKEAVHAKAMGFHGDVVRGNVGEFLVRGTSVFGLRHGSTASFGEKDQQQNVQPVAEGGDKEEKKEIVSYWGVPPSRVTKEDGTEWKWNSFRVRLLLSLKLSTFLSFVLVFIDKCLSALPFHVWFWFLESKFHAFLIKKKIFCFFFSLGFFLFLLRYIA
jgi:ubiquinol oxidase